MYGQPWGKTGWSYTDPAYAPGDAQNPIRANAPWVPAMGVMGAGSGKLQLPLMGLLALVAVMFLSETLRRRLL